VENLGRGGGGEAGEKGDGNGNGNGGGEEEEMSPSLSGSSKKEEEEEERKKPLACGGAISINHNWFNAHSLHWVWSLLRSERRSAVEAIEDCR